MKITKKQYKALIACAETLKEIASADANDQPYQGTELQAEVAHALGALYRSQGKDK